MNICITVLQEIQALISSGAIKAAKMLLRLAFAMDFPNRRSWLRENLFADVVCYGLSSRAMWNNGSKKSAFALSSFLDFEEQYCKKRVDKQLCAIKILGKKFGFFSPLGEWSDGSFRSDTVESIVKNLNASLYSISKSTTLKGDTKAFSSTKW